MSNYPRFHVTRYTPHSFLPGEYWPEDVNVEDITGVSGNGVRHAMLMAEEGGNWDLTAANGTYYQITYLGDNA